METKDHSSMNTRPRRANTGKYVELLKMKFGGYKHDTQFTRTGNRKKEFMHEMHKLDVYVTFKLTTAKKGTN